MNHIDTRLLMVFDAIRRSGSVSAAAELLGLGQPAVSVALAKLRHRFGDPLFVRTSRGMAPTPVAEELSASVRDVLAALDAVLGHHNVFDPQHADRRFRICMTDISQLVLLPRLWERLRVVAPGIRIEVHPLSGDTGRMLESGEADLAMGFMPQLEAGFYQQLLFRQSFVCVLGANHPRIADGLSLEQFETEDHAIVTSSGAGPLIVDREIARRLIRRRIALEIPNFLGAAFVAENTDLLVIIPQRLGDLLATHGSFRILPVPFPLPDYPVKQHWHERYHHDPGNRWLRGLIFELLSGHPGDEA